MNKLQILYSPYFYGNPYIDHSKHENMGMLGVAVDSTIALLCRLELIAGLSFPGEEGMEEVERRRQEAYFEILDQCIVKKDILWHSFQIDKEEKEAPKYRITTELLRWRDQLLLAGWDGKSLLPDKLEPLSRAEAMIAEDSCIRLGAADRWKTLSTKIAVIRNGIGSIECRAPRVLVSPLIADVLVKLGATFCEPESGIQLEPKHCSVLKVEEMYQAYEWLALQPSASRQVVVCPDAERMNSVFRNFAVPETSRVKSHRVIPHLCAMVDVPETLLWVGCNGDYGLSYPYEMLSNDESNELKEMGLKIASKSDMLDALNRLMVYTLNKIPGTVTLVYAQTDNGNILPEHPLVSALLHASGTSIKAADAPIKPKLVTTKQVSTGFQTQKEYQVKGNFKGVQPVKISYTSLEELIQHPFDFAVERELGLWDPLHSDDLHTEEGIVAHKIIELLINNNESLSDSAAFATRFEEAIDTVGKLLKSKENLLEKENFKSKVQGSIQVLDSIIHNCGLTPVKCELEIGNITLHTYGDSKASIDMLLIDPKDGQYVIFDFKYSTSENTYPKKLAMNKSIQFYFYEKIFNAWADDLSAKGEKVEGEYAPAHVKAYGYYLLPLETLYVPDGNKGSKWLHGDHIKVMPLDKKALSDINKALTAGYDERMAEFENGTLEEGTGMGIAELDYSQVEDVFPLDSAYNKKDIKGDTYSPKHIVLKNKIR